MKCPHRDCGQTEFDYQDCLNEPGATPQDGDIGICYRCGGWWELIDGVPQIYTPTPEEMKFAHSQLPESRERFRQAEQKARRRKR